MANGMKAVFSLRRSHHLHFVFRFDVLFLDTSYCFIHSFVSILWSIHLFMSSFPSKPPPWNLHSFASTLRPAFLFFFLFDFLIFFLSTPGGQFFFIHFYPSFHFPPPCGVLSIPSSLSYPAEIQLYCTTFRYQFLKIKLVCFSLLLLKQMRFHNHVFVCTDHSPCWSSSCRICIRLKVRLRFVHAICVHAWSVDKKSHTCTNTRLGGGA